MPKSSSTKRPKAKTSSAGSIATASPHGEELIALNLVTSYPVKWSAFQVLRDFLQNFYDSVPESEFASRVNLETGDDGSALTISVQGVKFSHEWLLSMGASSKTQAQNKDYAGYFGEGFKIAALCATRDFGWTVTVGSDQWQLKVTSVPWVIDGAPMRSLAYLLSRNSSHGGASWLRLEGLSIVQTSLLKRTVWWSFYYPENPLFGNLLWSDSKTAIWSRSKEPTPTGFPLSAGPSRGLLFAGRQARGSHELPFVVAAHDLRNQDRERLTYYDFQVVDALAVIARRLPSKVSMLLLQAVSSHWRDVNKTRFECGTWVPIVDALALNVANNEATKAEWRQKFPNLLVLIPLRRGDVGARNRRHESLAWLNSSGRDSRLVQKVFKKLDYPTLEQKCDRNGGYLHRSVPTGEEGRRVGLLLSFIRNFVLDLIPLQPIPEVLVVEAPRRAGWKGYAVCRPTRNGAWSSGGFRVRYDLSEIAICRSSLRLESPHQALATLLHEFCHAFGGDGTNVFGAALTDVLARLVALPAPLQALASDWIDSAPQSRDTG